MQKAFETMMQKIMSGMMKPVDLPRMMVSMMDNVFKKMGQRDRIEFIENMMPRCMAMMFSELAPAELRSVAEAMLQRMRDELKGQMNA